MTSSKANEYAITLRRTAEFFKARKQRLELYLKVTKKPDPTARVALAQLGLLEAMGIMEFVDPRLIEKQRKSNAAKLKKKYSTLSSEKLIALLVTKDLKLEDQIKESDRLYKINTFLMGQFEESGKKYLTDKKRQRIGTNKTNEPNRLALEECMQILIGRIQRAIKPTDYKSFITIVKERYPTQPYVKATKVAKNEGLKTKEEKNLVSTETKRKKWTDGYLRKFFEEFTGVKPTSLNK